MLKNGTVSTDDTPVIDNMGTMRYFREGGYICRELTIGHKPFFERVKSVSETDDLVLDFFRAYLTHPIEVGLKSGRSLNYLDLFCGGGGLSLGVQNASRFLGLKPRLVGAADIDQHALNLVKAHFDPLYPRAKSVDDIINYEVDLSGTLKDFISPPIIRDNQLESLRGRIDLLVGGPPCQGHSNLNNITRRFDPRNLLYLSMPAIAIALDVPKVIVENVRTITAAKENVVEMTKSIFRTHGYDVQEIVLDSSNFGVAQTRTRHFVVASKKKLPDLSLTSSLFHARTFSFNEMCTDLPELPHGMSMIQELGQLSESNKDRINYLFDNDVYDLPDPERPECHREGNTYQSVYGRMKGELPSGTITTGFASPGRGRYVHPSERRMISIREAGRLQGFPDWYWSKAIELKLKRAHYHKIVGDAVPSILVYPLLASLFAYD